MTQNLEFPKISYTGNGTTVDYTFDWKCGNADENYVNLNGVLLREGVEYELEDFTTEFGGTMRFNTAPAIDDIVFIFRRTPITQQIDYVDGEPFPTDSHEFQLDKDTRILQELFFGGIGFGGEVNLASVPHELEVEITNTAGTNAFIQPWTIDGLLSGIFYGEVVPDGDTAPLDGNPTAKPDGYIWWELGPSPLAGGDITIKMFTTPLSIDGSKDSPTVARAEFRYNSDTGEVEYGHDVDLPLELPVWTTDDGIDPKPTALLQYWIRFDVLTGAVDTSSAAVGTWIDAYSTAEDVNKYMQWYVADPGTSQAVTGTFTIAPDTGGGTPNEDFSVTRSITLIADQT
jgi:hypothetical protein